MQKEVPRDGVDTAVQPDVRIERLDEVRVALLVLRQRAERALGLRLDVALGLTEHEAVCADVLEVRRLALAAVAALDRDGLLGLEQCQVRTRRAALWPAHG